MSSPIDELEFLARSRHRIQLLRALREPCNRATLRDRTGTSKSTLSRALGEFESRMWVIRTGERYELTELGTLVVKGLDIVLEHLETSERLEPLGRWFPDGGFGFELERLRGSTVYVATQGNSLDILRRLATHLYDAESVHVLTGIVALGGIEVHRQAITDHGQTLQVILTAEALRIIEMDPEMTMAITEMHANDDVSVFRYEGSLPYFLARTEECTLIGLLDDIGTIRGLIRSDERTVLAWATETWNHYRAASVEVDSPGE